MTNEQYYELFNNKVEVGEYIGITIQHGVLMKYTAQETIKQFDELSTDEKLEVKNDTKKRYLSYIFLLKSKK